MTQYFKSCINTIVWNYIENKSCVINNLNVLIIVSICSPIGYIDIVNTWSIERVTRTSFPNDLKWNTITKSENKVILLITQ